MDHQYIIPKGIVHWPLFRTTPYIRLKGWYFLHIVFKVHTVNVQIIGARNWVPSMSSCLRQTSYSTQIFLHLTDADHWYMYNPGVYNKTGPWGPWGPKARGADPFLWTSWTREISPANLRILLDNYILAILIINKHKISFYHTYELTESTDHPGFEHGTFGFIVRCSTKWATESRFNRRQCDNIKSSQKVWNIVETIYF